MFYNKEFWKIFLNLQRNTSDTEQSVIFFSQALEQLVETTCSRNGNDNVIHTAQEY